MTCKDVVLWSEYLLVLQLSAKVSEEISAYKDAFKRAYGFSNAIVTRPHLTLMKFFQYESYEELIIKKVIQLADTVKVFNVQLDNFGTFNHTIYISVKTVQPILEIVYHRKNELKPLLSNRQNFFFSKNPHISIVRGLFASQCNTAWEDWRYKSYQRSFSAVGMTLLRRRKGCSHYEEVRRFYFKGLQPTCIQMKLF